MPIPDLNSPLNINRPAIEILMEQINVENHTELLVSDFEFSLPQPANIIYSNANTKITMTPRVTSSYFGSRDIYYKRMDLNQIFNNNEVEILVTTETTIVQLLGQINTKFGINLTAADIVDGPLPTVNPSNPDAVLSVAIATNPDSYLFVGTGNLILGPRVVSVDPTGIIRNYYIVSNFNPTSVYENRLMVYDQQYNLSQAFNLFRNTVSIEKVRIDNLIVLQNSDICLIGEFEFNAAIGTNPLQAHAVKSVIISNTGNIKSVSNNSLFGGDGAIGQICNKNLNKVYYLDKNNTIGTNPSRIYRFNLDGTPDVFNTPGLSYVPALIRVDDAGKVYTVSEQLNTTSIVSATAHKHIRIDRFNQLGAVDPTFNPLIISCSGTADVPPVVDLQPIQSLGAWILLKPSNSVGITAELPLLNLLPIVPVNSPTDSSFNPIFRINNDGSLYSVFKRSLLNNHPDSIAIDTTTLSSDKMYIAGLNTSVAYITNRVNPITGYTHLAPISYKNNGDQIRSVSSTFGEEIKWDSIVEVIELSNGNFLINGTGKARLQNGGWSESYDRLCLYSKNSELLRTIHVTVNTSSVFIQHARLNEFAST